MAERATDATIIGAAAEETAVPSGRTSDGSLSGPDLDEVSEPEAWLIRPLAADRTALATANTAEDAGAEDGADQRTATARTAAGSEAARADDVGGERTLGGRIVTEDSLPLVGHGGASARGTLATPRDRQRERYGRNGARTS